MSTASYGTESDENSLYTANVIANPSIEINGDEGRRLEDHAGAAVGHAAGSRRHRGQCRDRLPRDRIPAVGPGPERHRAGRRRASVHRLRHRQLHRRQLRPPRPVSGRGIRPAGLRPRRDGRQLEGRRRGAQGAGRRRAEGRAVDDPHRHGLAVLRRARRRAHEARPAAARSRRRSTTASPTTRHISHLYDAIGIRDAYHGRYKRIDGSVVEGPSLSAAWSRRPIRRSTPS